MPWTTTNEFPPHPRRRIRSRYCLRRLVTRLLGLIPRRWRSMKRNQLKAGETHLAAAGGWIFEVESIEAHVIYYTVVQTDQHCQTTPSDFAARVKRPIVLIPEPNRRR